MRNRTERLKIVFLLGDPIKSAAFNLGKAEVKLDTLKQPIEAIDILEKLIDVMRASDRTIVFKSDGNMIALETLRRDVDRKGKFTTLICDSLSFQFGVVGSKRHMFVQIDEIKSNAAGDWAEWVKPFCDVPGFVQAWVADVDYEHWQNVTDPNRFEMQERPHAEFKLVSNGLPHPLERKIIDISDNPGRWILRDGYVEAIGATMWLGESFWERVGADRKERVKSANWLNVEAVNDNALHVQASENSFSDQRTAEVQNKLRAILYGT